MSAQVLIGSAVAATAATVVLTRGDGRSVGRLADDTGGHLKWNLRNIRDGICDDVSSFKHALLHTLNITGPRYGEQGHYGRRYGGSSYDGGAFNRNYGRDGYGRGASSTGPASYNSGSAYGAGSSYDGRGHHSGGGLSYDGSSLRDKGANVVDSASDAASGAVNSVKSAASNTASSVGNAASNSANAVGSTVGNAVQGLYDKVDSLKQAGSNLTRDAGDKLQQSYHDAKQSINDATKDASEKSHSIFNWGFGSAEKSRAVAIGDFDRANKGYKLAVEQLNLSKKGFFSKGDEQLRKNVEIAKLHLEECRKKLEFASADFEKHAKQSISEISNKLDEQNRELRNRGFFSWFKSSPSSSSKSNMGNPNSWGECADQAVKDAGHAVKDAGHAVKDAGRNVSNKLGPEASLDRLDALDSGKSNSWFSSSRNNNTTQERILDPAERVAANAARALEGWGESAAQFAQDELEEERRRANKFWKS